jgi:hypothetical protein
MGTGMTETGTKAAEPPAGKMPYEAALLEVVKGLHKDPVLLFGIGAGIVVVGALAFTTSLPLVLVLAGLFVVVLVARAHQRAQRIRSGADIGVVSSLSSFSDSDVATTPEGSRFRFRGVFLGSRVKNSRIGVVGGNERRKPPES